MNAKWAERDTPNRLKAAMSQGGKPWAEDPNHPHYVAAKRATQHVYKVVPDMTCEGGSIPVTLTLQQATGKNVVLLPVGASDDGAHSQNEKIDIRNYIEGVSADKYCYLAKLFNFLVYFSDQTAGRLFVRGGSIEVNVSNPRYETFRLIKFNAFVTIVCV